MSKNEDKRQLKCSLCGKNQEQVKRLIAGPNVYICDECVELCDEIIQEEIDEVVEEDTTSLPKPKEMMEILNDYVIGQDKAKKAEQKRAEGKGQENEVEQDENEL